MGIRRCQCEHKDHFEDCIGHAYEAKREDVELVDTEFGHYALCEACRMAGHMTNTFSCDRGGMVDSAFREAEDAACGPRMKLKITDPVADNVVQWSHNSAVTDSKYRRMVVEGYFLHRVAALARQLYSEKHLDADEMRDLAQSVGEYYGAIIGELIEVEDED